MKYRIYANHEDTGEVVTADSEYDAVWSYIVSVNPQPLDDVIDPAVYVCGVLYTARLEEWDE